MNQAEDLIGLVDPIVLRLFPRNEPLLDVSVDTWAALILERDMKLVPFDDTVIALDDSVEEMTWSGARASH